MTTATIKALMDLKKEFPINNINNRKRFSPEEINKIIDNKINEVLELAEMEEARYTNRTKSGYK